MTEKQWLVADSIFDVVHLLQGEQRNHRRLLLFSCACFRRVWHLLRLDAAKKVVEQAEAYADGEVTAEELQAANESAEFAILPTHYDGSAESGTLFSARILNAIEAARYLASPWFNRSGGAAIVARDTSLDSARDYFHEPDSIRMGSGLPDDEIELAEKVKLLRDIFGNPFQPVAFDPAWRTEHTVGLAAKMYEERDFRAMPILADALEEAGCENADILTHCREPGVHVRGCWVVDLVLGKS